MAFTPVGHDLSPTFRAVPTHWRPVIDEAHKRLSTAVLGGAVIFVLAWPGAGSAVSSWSGAILLVGGAVIGVPHGTSDFVVAHRVLRPRFGGAWLPIFLVAYLAIVAVMMVGWMAMPLVTLLAFVLLSGLHFGHGDLGPGRRRNGLAVAVRASTPLLPVLLAHPKGVAPLIGALAGVQESAVLATLEDLRWLLIPWGLAVMLHMWEALRPGPYRGAWDAHSADLLEIGAIGLAALVLPPLLGFALYFCLVHAVRHMIDIADDHEPRNARRAVMLVLAVIVPSSAVCLVALGLAWNGVAGTLDTTEVLAWSLRLIAALTVPHMALEAWAEPCSTYPRRP